MKYPKEYIHLDSKHGESLKSRKYNFGLQWSNIAYSPNNKSNEILSIVSETDCSAAYCHLQEKQISTDTSQ
jgi:exoribonuclease II